jgi:hypothetical protein
MCHVFLHPVSFVMCVLSAVGLMVDPTCIPVWLVCADAQQRRAAGARCANASLLQPHLRQRLDARLAASSAAGTGDPFWNRADIADAGGHIVGLCLLRLPGHRASMLIISIVVSCLCVLEPEITNQNNYPAKPRSKPQAHNITT